MGIASCAPYSLGYLDRAVNHATQDDIAKDMGSPPTVRKADNGGIEWVYYDRGSSVAGYTGYARQAYCREFVLVFDRDKILRAWRTQDCHNNVPPPNASPAAP
jgi:hypothetical protein